MSKNRLPSEILIAADRGEDHDREFY